jgi:fumarate reductase (CoM/CoB) subunit A
MVAKMKEESLKTDVLVVGSGSAGLRSAIEARRKRDVGVLLVSKDPIGLGNCTALAGGFFRTLIDGLNEQLDTKRFVQKIIESGQYLGNQRLIEILVEEGQKRVIELKESGVPLRVSTADMGYDIIGHEKAVSLGFKITLALKNLALDMGVKMSDGIAVLRLVKDGHRVAGAIVLEKRNSRILAIEAKAVILATGGAGAIYSERSTPPGTTGEGYSIAYQAGAELMDMEFVDFLPMLSGPGLPRWAFGEYFVDAVKGLTKEGIFYNSKGESILKRYGLMDRQVDRGELIRALSMETREGRGINGTVILDLTAAPAEEWKKSERLIWVDHILRKAGVDPRKMVVHVSPAAHFFMGGVVINEKCETCVPGLFAAGECTGGIHGSNRLGGNALTDAVVFGARAGRYASEYAKSNKRPKIDPADLKQELEKIDQIKNRELCVEGNPKVIKKGLNTIVSEYVGPIREGKGLRTALDELKILRKEGIRYLHASNSEDVREGLEAVGMADVAEFMITAALIRTESRGTHFRIDYPRQDNENWLKNIIMKKESGYLKVTVHHVD